MNMPRTYVTDLQHFLDDQGDLAEMPNQAKQMAAFLVLIIDAITPEAPEDFVESGVRCRARKCTGEILARLDPGDEVITWHCPACGQNGVVRNWQGTKWDRRGEG